MAEAHGHAPLRQRTPPKQEPFGSFLQERTASLTSTGAVLALLLGTAAMGQLGIGLARPVFVAGCLGVAALAYRRGGLGLHVEVCIVLFVFAPFVRRLVDLHTGFDPSSAMLVGPLLALTAAFPELRRLLSDRLPQAGRLLPCLVIGLCVTYGWVISAFQDSLLAASIAAAKDVIPLLYAVCLMLRPDQGGAVLRSAARAFLVVAPIIGIYGIFQHLAPPEWDRYWMISSKMLSIGEPEPGQVRVFSTMNSPASFAFYAICGLLLFSFTRSFVPTLLLPVVALLPLSMALLLSGVRTAWISAGVALLFCAFFERTRKRTGLLAVCLAVGVTITLLYTSFGAGVASRLDTLGGGVSQDGSGQDRLHDYAYVFTEGTRYLLGTGLSGNADQHLAAADGQLLLSVVQMGLVVGVLHTATILLAGAQALLTLRRNRDVLPVVAGAVVAGNMSAVLLLSFSQGELGFLFWMLVGVLGDRPSPSRSRPDRINGSSTIV